MSSLRSSKRIRQYKILAGAIFVLLLILIFTPLVDMFDAADGNAYELNRKINERNETCARANSFGFTDIPRSTQKAKGVYRIAVLGDSFIWGDGLPYEKVWSHKLETKLRAQHHPVEVLSWGHNGWSTLDEYNFYQQHGKDYDIDLLIIAWVDNDPDMGKIPVVPAGDPQKQYPLIYKVSPSLAQTLLNNANNDLYNNWLQKIYSDSNLNDYKKLLSDFRQTLAQNKTPVLVVMTPGQFDSRTRRHFEMAEPLILQANFNCLNLYGLTEKQLENYSSAQIHANPVNGHPGDLMTEVFAEDVKVYLEGKGYPLGGE